MSNAARQLRRRQHQIEQKEYWRVLARAIAACDFDEPSFVTSTRVSVTKHELGTPTLARKKRLASMRKSLRKGGWGDHELEPERRRNCTT